MKRLLTVVGVLCAIGQLLEYLALPGLLALIGLWNGLPWQYYVLTIGGYFGVLLLGETLVWLIFRMLGKAYPLRLTQASGKIAQRISRNRQNSPPPSPEEN